MSTFKSKVFLGHAGATLAKFRVPETEEQEVVAFGQSLEGRNRRIAARPVFEALLDKLSINGRER